MTGIDRSIQRVVVVIALMAVAAIALRGFIPGAEPITERERPASNPAALVIVIVMVCAAVAIIAFAIVFRLRDRTATHASAAPLPRGAGGVGRPSWRFTLVVLALVIAWLLLVLLLMRLGASPDQPVAETPAGPATSTASPDAAPGTTPADPDPESDSNVIGYLIPPMLILMVLVIVGTAIASRRQRLGPARYTEDNDDSPPTTTATAGDSLVRAAEVGLAEIVDRTREPREAIIACYAAMERELTMVPGAAPLDCDTPSEVLARAVHNRALRADSATELVELFEEARFSPHVMTEAHRDAAMAVLERVLAELPDGSTRSRP
ncbi:hypothetical protein BST36_11905 [Mycolicibacterium moriokaense]|jgi:hypothetical protein|uniref:Protein-glutamine gamma-glutamyltransferase-like C-terminal domain-containing protein n=1 Tax=Mycolicibacterium moriokaense TaxID=39691 RepID=A0AAD1H5Q0_9MYCO|nr:DUF4129 domain-containing protein [Mycolicibacterium moriokaense]MCV7037640.1 DUF4129 domain-containing protein [Mycolicibacterium moriokaense]ORB23690.1 hypothetical protein BST36_11905 [Mycolicibacterium moriokaense]BBW99421.1 hypothetical protein MMOR_03580 [Mycolicibacterium moriokaense]